MKKNTVVADSYNKISKHYTNQQDALRDKKYLDMFASYLPKGSTILDVGCGAGIPIDKYLVEQGFVVNGIDISEKQIVLAKNNVAHAFFEVKDMSTLQEYEYCVNGIVSFYAIFHIPREEHATLFKKFASFLPKGGIMLVTMGANGEDSGSIQEFHGEKMFYSFYAPEKNIELVQEAGFTVLVNEISAKGGEKHQIILAKI